MAITIQAFPDNYSSVHGDLIFTVAEVVKTADPVTYPNYKFVGDVYINGVLKARLNKVPDPITRIGIFNVGQIIRNYIATIFNPSPNVLVAQQLGNGVFWITLAMKFGENYAYTTYTNLTVDSDRIFFNNYNGRLVGVTSSLSSFADKLATNRPEVSQTLLSSAYNFLPYFPTSTTPFDVTVIPYGGGAVNVISVTPSNAYDLQLLNVAPAALNAIQSGTITVATTSYDIQIGSQLYSLELICEPVYEVYTIHFLNKYGGFESKIFSKVSRKTVNIERNDFGKLPYTVDSSGVVGYKNANGVYNESRSVYSSQYTEKLQLNSDLLTDDEYTWLEQLVISPIVYIEDGGYFFPCIITETNYEPKKNINDELSNLTINIEYGNQLNGQYR